MASARNRGRNAGAFAFAAGDASARGWGGHGWGGHGGRFGHFNRFGRFNRFGQFGRFGFPGLDGYYDFPNYALGCVWARQLMPTPDGPRYRYFPVCDGY